MEPKCRAYKEIESSLSKTGQTWSTYVRSCLQKQLATVWANAQFGSVSCSAIDEQFFDNHLPCYLDGPTSFCQMTTSDAIKIMWQAKDVLWKGRFWSVTKSGAYLKFKCDSDFWELVLKSLSKSRVAKFDPIASLNAYLSNQYGQQGWAPSVLNVNNSSNLTAVIGFVPVLQGNVTMVNTTALIDSLVAWSKNTSLPFQIELNGVNVL